MMPDAKVLLKFLTVFVNADILQNLDNPSLFSVLVVVQLSSTPSGCFKGAVSCCPAAPGRGQSNIYPLVASPFASYLLKTESSPFPLTNTFLWFIKEAWQCCMFTLSVLHICLRINKVRPWRGGAAYFPWVPHLESSLYFCEFITSLCHTLHGAPSIFSWPIRGDWAFPEGALKRRQLEEGVYEATCCSVESIY